MTGVGVLSHWTLLVGDLERSDRFYRDVLGWRPVVPPAGDAADPRAPAGGRSARYVRDGQRIELTTLPGLEASAVPPAVNHLGLSHVTVATDPAPLVVKALEDCGVVVRHRTLGNFVPGDDPSPTQFLFEDPDGNLIETFAGTGDDWNPFGPTGDSDPEPAATGIRHLSHWSLCVSDPARSLSFYRDVLGWQELAVMPWEGEGPSCVMDVGPARLTTWLLASGDQRIEIIHFDAPGTERRPGAGQEAPGLAGMTLVVPDLGRLADRLAAAGVGSLAEGSSPAAGLVAQDPDGVEIRCVAQPLDWRTGTG